MSSLGIIAPILLENNAGEMHHPAAEGCVPRSCSHCVHQTAAKRFGERFIARGTFFFFFFAYHTGAP